MNRKKLMAVGVALLACAAAGMARWATVWMGKQPDGSYIVSSGQRVEGGSIAFDGRPIELALHPSGTFYAVLNKKNVFLGTAEGVREGTAVPLGKSGPGFRGLGWSPDGRRLFATSEEGYVREYLFEGGKLQEGDRIEIKAEAKDENPVPGGFAIARDGARMFVVAANRNAVVEVDLAAKKRVREFPVENVPFEARLSEDERTLIVSNWGGRIPRAGDRTAKSLKQDIVVDERSTPISGTVSLIDRATGATRHVEVGIHPTAIEVDGAMAYVANAMSDSISEIDLAAGKVTRTIPLQWGSQRVIGGMPNALAIRGRTLYVVPPSGDTRAWRSEFGPEVRRSIVPVSKSIAKMRVARGAAGRSVVVPVNNRLEVAEDHCKSAMSPGNPCPGACKSANRCSASRNTGLLRISRSMSPYLVQIAGIHPWCWHRTQAAGPPHISNRASCRVPTASGGARNRATRHISA